MGRDIDGSYDGARDGHQAKCPETPLTCPNDCGSEMVKRKDMKDHRNQCPQEPMECPFREAGCEENLVRCQIEGHMSSNQQQHLLLVLKDCHETKAKLSKASKELLETKNELSEMKKELSEAKKELSEARNGVFLTKGWLSRLDKEVNGTLTTAVQLLSQGKEADTETIGFVITCSSRLRNIGDRVEVVMPKFSEYRRSGKVWRSPPFFYREAYKMCLAVYANGVGEGAGTHVSIAILLLEMLTGVDAYQLQKTGCVHVSTPTSSYTSRQLANSNGIQSINVCFCQPIGILAQMLQLSNKRDKFCSLESPHLHLVNDNLSLTVFFIEPCCLQVSIC